MSKAHSKSTVILLGGYNASGWFNSVDVGGVRDEADVTNFASTAKEFLIGHNEGNVSLEGFWDGAVGAVDDILRPLFEAGTGVPLTVGFVGVSTLHDLVIVANLKQTTYSPGASLGNAVALSVEGRADAGPDYGIILAQLASQGVGTTTFTGYDFGATDTTSNGFAGNLHVTAIVSGSPSLAGKFQDSADGSSYADITGGAFAAATTVGGQHLTGTTSVRRHARWAYTISGTGSMTFAASFAKKR